MTKHIVKYLFKGIATAVLVALCAIVATSISPIYDFAKPEPFSGPDLFNPYRNIDTAHCWKRANFHTHTRIEGPTNECELWPEEVIASYEPYGYDIVTLSNHNTLTAHPSDPLLDAKAYEHGYNLLKYHKLVFGAKDGVMLFDHLLPIFASQRQWQIDLLTAKCDILQLNHPRRTPLTTQSMLERLSGYEIMELDSGKTTENEYWDTALSAGHYSFGLANDDLHYPDRSSKIAVRCNFLCTPTANYLDVLHTLRDGCYYSMRVPDYGSGDWSVKQAKNRTLPRITDIGSKGDSIYISLSDIARRIVIYGQHHTTLTEIGNSNSLSYTLPTDEPYARIVAEFEDGAYIYTNPFARYDSSTSDRPTNNSTHTINWALTIVYNIVVLFIALLVITLIVGVWRPKKRDYDREK